MELAAAGWRPEEIASALGSWADTDLPVPVPRRRPYLSARDAFLYLVLFATLYVVAFDAGSILFALIRWRWPDASSYGSGWLQAAAQVRFATAALVIAFPIYLYVSRVIGRSVALDPEKRGSPIRKWLTYITLFLAALVLIGDAIALVAHLLSGELGVRFVLEVAVVFAIAGIVFGHYLSDLRHDESDHAGPRGERVLARAGAVLTLVVIVTGLVFAGSPREERQRQLDDRRVEDLSAIATAIDMSYGENRRLPGSILEVMHFRMANVSADRDPATNAPYEYRALDSLRYELCATFDRADTAVVARPFPMGSRFWNHGAGRACFALQVPRSSRRT